MCNTTGLAIGSMIGSVWSTLLTSKDFCNKYVRTTPDTGGIVTMERESLKNLTINRLNYRCYVMYIKTLFKRHITLTFFTIVNRFRATLRI